MSGFAIARQKMVDGQVRTSDVTDRRILDAMLAHPREAFVPSRTSARWPTWTSTSTSAAGGFRGRLPDQASVLIGRWCRQAVRSLAADRVSWVAGCATGYTAALVATRLAGQVTATESEPAQVWRKAMEVLAQLGPLAT